MQHAGKLPLTGTSPAAWLSIMDSSMDGAGWSTMTGYCPCLHAGQLAVPEDLGLQSLPCWQITTKQAICVSHGI